MPDFSPRPPRKTLFKPELKRRGIYILPNLFTTAALFAGFYAIVQAMETRFEVAAMAIFVAMIFDGLDGRVARLTHTQSAFGAEYDSLADMVSFGVAPALVIYEWALSDLGRMGWVAAFIYCAAAALRLARFNTTIGLIDKRFFQGLPSPAAAALVAGTVWVFAGSQSFLTDGKLFAWFITFVAGLSMISNVYFYSFKTINLKKSVPFFCIVLFALVFALVSLSPEIALFAFFMCYAASGYLYWLWCFCKKQRGKRQ